MNLRKKTLQEISQTAYRVLREDEGMSPTEIADEVRETSLEDCVAKRLADWGVKAEDPAPRDVYPGFENAGEAAQTMCLWFSKIGPGKDEKRAMETEPGTYPEGSPMPEVDARKAEVAAMVGEEPVQALAPEETATGVADEITARRKAVKAQLKLDHTLPLRSHLLPTLENYFMSEEAPDDMGRTIKSFLRIKLSLIRSHVRLAEDNLGHTPSFTASVENIKHTAEEMLEILSGKQRV